MNLLYPKNIDQYEESFRKDEKTLEFLKAMNIKTLIIMEELDLMRYLTANREVIEFRQKIFSDMDANPELYNILKTLTKQISDIKDVALKRTNSAQETEDILYSFNEVSMFTDMIITATDSMKNLYDNIKSEGLRELFDAMVNISKQEDFNDIIALVAKINNDIKYAHSITLGVNLDPKYEVYEVGVVSINSEYFVSNDLFSKLFGIGNIDSSLKCLMPLVEGKQSSQFLDNAIHRILNNSISRSAGRARSVLLNYIYSTVSQVYSLRDDLDFIITCYDFLHEIKEKRCPLCIPQCSETGVKITGMVNPHLLKKMAVGLITANDTEFDSDTSVSIITGPNSGGKSVYLKSVGLCFILYQLGLFIPAGYAEMSPVNSFYCHFPVEDPKNESRLVDECRRMKEILNVLDKDSLLLMDESFSGTNSTEGAAIALEVLKHIQAKECLCLFSTHLHDVAANVKYLNEKKPYISTLSAEYKNGFRTYKIIPKEPEGLSFAYEVAKEYGLEYNG